MTHRTMSERSYHGATSRSRWKEGNISFNDVLNTSYLRLYGVRHVVKDHSDSERGNPLPPLHGLFFCMHHPADSSRGALTGTRNSAMGPP